MGAASLPGKGRLGVPRSRRLLRAVSDERLVDQIRRGSQAAFEVVYDRHHRGILSFCRHMLGSREEAEDTVQHTFIAAYNDLVESDKPIRLKAWLYTIARNRCLSVLRARREQASAELEIETAGFGEEVQQRAELRELLADVQELPEDQRAALVLSELGGLSHADIGRIVGCEPVKVKSLVFQSRSALIESREARETPCAEIREQLATLRGGALRRGILRKHLRACESCREFRDEVRRQRVAIAAVLPVLPTAGLKGAIFAGVGGGGGIGGAMTAAGGAAGGGLLTAFGSGGGAAKIAAIAAVAGGTATGGVVLSRDDEAGVVKVSPPPAQEAGSVTADPDAARPDAGRAAGAIRVSKGRGGAPSAAGLSIGGADPAGAEGRRGDAPAGGPGSRRRRSSSGRGEGDPAAVVLVPPPMGAPHGPSEQAGGSGNGNANGHDDGPSLPGTRDQGGRGHADGLGHPEEGGHGPGHDDDGRDEGDDSDRPHLPVVDD